MSTKMTHFLRRIRRCGEIQRPTDCDLFMRLEIQDQLRAGNLRVVNEMLRLTEKGLRFIRAHEEDWQPERNRNALDNRTTRTEQRNKKDELQLS